MKKLIHYFLSQHKILSIGLLLAHPMTKTMEAESSQHGYENIRKLSNLKNNNNSDFNYDTEIAEIQTLMKQPPSSQDKENVHFYDNDGWYIGKKLELATSLKNYITLVNKEHANTDLSSFEPFNPVKGFKETDLFTFFHDEKIQKNYSFNQEDREKIKIILSKILFYIHFIEIAKTEENKKALCILFPEEVINQLINLIDVEKEPQLYQAINIYFDTYPLVRLRNTWNNEAFAKLSLKEKINFIASIDIDNSNYQSNKEAMQEAFANTLNNKENEEDILEIINKDKKILVNIIKNSFAESKNIPDYLKELFITLSLLDDYKDILGVIINFYQLLPEEKQQKILIDYLSNFIGICNYNQTNEIDEIDLSEKASEENQSQQKLIDAIKNIKETILETKQSKIVNALPKNDINKLSDYISFLLNNNKALEKETLIHLATHNLAHFIDIIKTTKSIEEIIEGLSETKQTELIINILNTLEENIQNAHQANLLDMDENEINYYEKHRDTIYHSIKNNFNDFDEKAKLALLKNINKTNKDFIFDLFKQKDTNIALAIEHLEYSYLEEFIKNSGKKESDIGLDLKYLKRLNKEGIQNNSVKEEIENNVLKYLRQDNQKIALEILCEIAETELESQKDTIRELIADYILNNNQDVTKNLFLFDNGNNLIKKIMLLADYGHLINTEKCENEKIEFIKNVLAHCQKNVNDFKEEEKNIFKKWLETYVINNDNILNTLCNGKQPELNLMEDIGDKKNNSLEIIVSLCKSLKCNLGLFSNKFKNDYIQSLEEKDRAEACYDFLMYDKIAALLFDTCKEYLDINKIKEIKELSQEKQDEFLLLLLAIIKTEEYYTTYKDIIHRVLVSIINDSSDLMNNQYFIPLVKASLEKIVAYKESQENKAVQEIYISFLLNKKEFKFLYDYKKHLKSADYSKTVISLIQEESTISNIISYITDFKKKAKEIKKKISDQSWIQIMKEVGRRCKTNYISFVGIEKNEIFNSIPDDAFFEGLKSYFQENKNLSLEEILEMIRFEDCIPKNFLGTRQNLLMYQQLRSKIKDEIKNNSKFHLNNIINTISNTLYKMALIPFYTSRIQSIETDNNIQTIDKPIRIGSCINEFYANINPFKNKNFNDYIEINLKDTHLKPTLSFLIEDIFNFCITTLNLNNIKLCDKKLKESLIKDLLKATYLMIGKNDNTVDETIITKVIKCLTSHQDIINTISYDKPLIPSTTNIDKNLSLLINKYFELFKDNDNMKTILRMHIYSLLLNQNNLRSQEQIVDIDKQATFSLLNIIEKRVEEIIKEDEKKANTEEIILRRNFISDVYYRLWEGVQENNQESQLKYEKKWIENSHGEVFNLKNEYVDLNLLRNKINHIINKIKKMVGDNPKTEESNQELIFLLENIVRIQKELRSGENYFVLNNYEIITLLHLFYKSDESVRAKILYTTCVNFSILQVNHLKHLCQYYPQFIVDLLQQLSEIHFEEKIINESFSNIIIQLQKSIEILIKNNSDEKDMLLKYYLNFIQNNILEIARHVDITKIKQSINDTTKEQNFQKKYNELLDVIRIIQLIAENNKNIVDSLNSSKDFSAIKKNACWLIIDQKLLIKNPLAYEFLLKYFQPDTEKEKDSLKVWNKTFIHTQAQEANELGIFKNLLSRVVIHNKELEMDLYQEMANYLHQNTLHNLVSIPSPYKNIIKPLLNRLSLTPLLYFNHIGIEKQPSYGEFFEHLKNLKEEKNESNYCPTKSDLSDFKNNKYKVNFDSIFDDFSNEIKECIRKMIKILIENDQNSIDQLPQENESKKLLELLNTHANKRDIEINEQVNNIEKLLLIRDFMLYLGNLFSEKPFYGEEENILSSALSLFKKKKDKNRSGMYIEYAQGEGKSFQAYILKKLQEDSMYHMEDRNITKKELFKTLNDKNVSIMNFLTEHSQETGLVAKNKQLGIFESLNINPQKMLGLIWKGPQGIVAEEIIVPTIKKIIKKGSDEKSDKKNDIDVLD